MFCVSCKSNTHASWDRDCPEFCRRCDQFDENYPENNLPYFPSKESWTLTPRPNKLHRSEKYPSRYAVTPLQQPERAAREAPTKAKGRHPKQKSSKLPPNQSTMDQFVHTGNTQPTEQGKLTNMEEADTAAFTNIDFPPLKYYTPEEGRSAPGWE